MPILVFIFTFCHDNNETIFTKIYNLGTQRRDVEFLLLGFSRRQPPSAEIRTRFADSVFHADYYLAALKLRKICQKLTLLGNIKERINTSGK